MLDRFDEFARLLVLWFQASRRFEESEGFVKLTLTRKSDTQVQMSLSPIGAKAYELLEFHFGPAGLLDA